MTSRSASCTGRPSSAVTTLQPAGPRAAEVIAKVGFKMFLGITAEVVGAASHEFSLQFAENPLAEFVELPEQYSSLAYSNMLCGVLRGALEMVQVRSLTRRARHMHLSVWPASLSPAFAPDGRAHALLRRCASSAR